MQFSNLQMPVPSFFRGKGTLLPVKLLFVSILPKKSPTPQSLIKMGCFKGKRLPSKIIMKDFKSNSGIVLMNESFNSQKRILCLPLKPPATSGRSWRTILFTKVIPWLLLIHYVHIKPDLLSITAFLKRMPKMLLL